MSYQKTISLVKTENLLAIEAVLLYLKVNANLLMEIVLEECEMFVPGTARAFRNPYASTQTFLPQDSRNNKRDIQMSPVTMPSLLGIQT
jgi:hypothetical protein